MKKIIAERMYITGCRRQIADAYLFLTMAFSACSENELSLNWQIYVHFSNQYIMSKVKEKCNNVMFFNRFTKYSNEVVLISKRVLFLLIYTSIIIVNYDSTSDNIYINIWKNVVRMRLWIRTRTLSKFQAIAFVLNTIHT